MLDPINRLSLHGRRRPAVFFAVMLAVTAAFYIPGLIYYGPSSWFEFGPFSVQHGRVMLYATYFFFGAGVGVHSMDRGLLAADGRMAKVSWDWLILTIVPYYLMWVLISIKRENLGNPSPLPNWYEASYAVCFTVFSVAILFLILAYFLRFANSGRSVLDAMQADAYGMFLVHYPIALWLQYWLFDFNVPATVKAPIGFVLTVALSWGLTRALRQIPGANKVL
jgi:surface polysaccharide O-acyltransferase-like enzyme